MPLPRPPDPFEFLPKPPWHRPEGPPPAQPAQPEQSAPPSQPSAPAQAEPPPVRITADCAYGLECCKNHFLRAHLYMSEALRFSSKGAITPEAVEKVRQAREQLLCEDDFQRALAVPAPLQYEVLRVLAGTRDLWKQIEASGLDNGYGTPSDLLEAAQAIQALYQSAYELDRRFRTQQA